MATDVARVRASGIIARIINNARDLRAGRAGSGITTNTAEAEIIDVQYGAAVAQAQFSDGLTNLDGVPIDGIRNSRFLPVGINNENCGQSRISGKLQNGGIAVVPDRPWNQIPIPLGYVFVVSGAGKRIGTPDIEDRFRGLLVGSGQRLLIQLFDLFRCRRGAGRRRFCFIGRVGELDRVEDALRAIRGIRRRDASISKT